MKDVTETLSNVIFTLLDGQITYGKNTVKIFEKTPTATEAGISSGQLFHYVEVSDIIDTETAENSDTFTHDVSLELDIVVGFPGIGSKMVTNNIVNQVMRLITTTKGSVVALGADFTNVICYLEDSMERVQYGSEASEGFKSIPKGNHKLHIKTLRYRLVIDEN